MTKLADELCAEVRNQCEQAEHFKNMWVAGLIDENEKLRGENKYLKAEAESFRRMLIDACHDLGLINEALGLDPDDGGAEPILDAIAKLKGTAQ